MNKPLALWAVPRSISTAFERMVVERNDHIVFHEPFSVAFYYGPQRCSERFAESASRPEYSYERVLETVLEPAPKPVFFKDIAYQAAPIMDQAFADRFHNTFLIRRPEAVVASLAKFWPDFTEQETGYADLHRLFELSLAGGQEPVVVDARDLLADPDTTIEAWCNAVGLPFMPEALEWEPGPVAGWRLWDEWHTDAMDSSGFRRRSKPRDLDLPSDLEAMAARCQPYYEALRAHRLG